MYLLYNLGKYSVRLDPATQALDGRAREEPMAYEAAARLAAQSAKADRTATGAACRSRHADRKSAPRKKISTSRRHQRPMFAPLVARTIGPDPKPLKGHPVKRIETKGGTRLALGLIGIGVVGSGKPRNPRRSKQGVGRHGQR